MSYKEKTRLSDQNNPSKHGFFALFCKKRKDRFRNKLNISALHFCILQFRNVEECTLNRITKKSLKFSDFLIVVYIKSFADAEVFICPHKM